MTLSDEAVRVRDERAASRSPEEQRLLLRLRDIEQSIARRRRAWYLDTWSLKRMWTLAQMRGQVRSMHDKLADERESERLRRWRVENPPCPRCGHDPDGWCMCDSEIVDPAGAQ